MVTISVQPLIEQIQPRDLYEFLKTLHRPKRKRRQTKLYYLLHIVSVFFTLRLFIYIRVHPVDLYCLLENEIYSNGIRICHIWLFPHPLHN
jgi:hypothetical protein